MAITGIFTKTRPNIGGLIFDAVLEESDELQTEITRFPVEFGSYGNDHAVTMNQTFRMLVGISDNPFRALASQAAQTAVFDNISDIGVSGTSLSTILSNGAGIAVGSALGAVSGQVAAIAGLGASIANAAFASGQASTRSASVLEAIRAIQRDKTIFTLVTSKGTYENCMIRRTSRVTDISNENGLELAVELEQLRIYSTRTTQTAFAGYPSVEDTATTQATPIVDYGRSIASPEASSL